ncbi:MAG TPA: hypothetical protein VMT29_09180 [Steroidobacteraceae bacterium]|nr:hypothetical protein [Steroidobacteraceae bacterium]
MNRSYRAVALCASLWLPMCATTMAPAQSAGTGHVSAAVPPAAPARSADPLQSAGPCGGFTWNVSHELALFAAAPTPGKAGSDVSQAPVLQTDRLYELSLTAQEKVHYAVPPGKKALADGATGGLIRFRVESAGPFRIALDRPFWVDVVAAGKLIAARDFQGRPGCEAPHKIVEFILPAHQDLVLQFSHAVNSRVRVSITASTP